MFGDEKQFKTVAEQGWRNPATFFPTGADILASNARTVQQMKAWQDQRHMYRSAALLRRGMKHAA